MSACILKEKNIIYAKIVELLHIQIKYNIIRLWFDKCANCLVNFEYKCYLNMCCLVHNKYNIVKCLNTKKGKYLFNELLLHEKSVNIKKLS